MNVAVAVDDDVRYEARPSASEAGPAAKRVVVGYGFWIFLLSDIVMFAAIFAAYAVLTHATAGGPGGLQLFNQRSVAIETACLLASSYTCGLMSLALGCPHHLRAGSRVPGAGGAGVRRHDRDRGRSATQRFPLCLFYPGRLSRAACHCRPGLAGSDDGPGRNQRLSSDRGAASALLFTVLACARHCLGMAVHGGLSDGVRS